MKIPKSNSSQIILNLKIMSKDNESLLTFGGHLEVLRRMLFRIIGVTIFIAILIFIIKDITWRILLAPSEWNFVTYRIIEQIIRYIGLNFHFTQYEVELIATDLSSQFMTHVTTSVYLGCLIASPYILFELFRFALPALYENERKYSVYVAIIIFVLFIVGVLMSYFVIFPISFRFLGTYSVAEKVNSMITLNSYISTFTSLTLILGIVFQLPVIVWVLAKMKILDFTVLSKYRKYALFIITAISAIITPPDIMSCLLVTAPLYLLYECSIWIAKKVNRSVR